MDESVTVVWSKNLGEACEGNLLSEKQAAFGGSKDQLFMELTSHKTYFVLTCFINESLHRRTVTGVINLGLYEALWKLVYIHQGWMFK